MLFKNSLKRTEFTTDKKIVSRSFSATAIPVMTGFLAALFLWSVDSVIVLGNSRIYAENGLLQNTQATVLVIAYLAILFSIAVEKRLDKLIFLYCSLLCYAFFLGSWKFRMSMFPSC